MELECPYTSSPPPPNILHKVIDKYSCALAAKGGGTREGALILNMDYTLEVIFSNKKG